MEGDGMVAVVQGLKDAGLAVTLMNSTYLQHAHNSKKTIAVPTIMHASVETSPNVKLRSIDTQARDAHYASTYQLAHCNIRPSSPPQRLREFPPQRPELSRNQGNFQIGGQGSVENTFSPASSRSFRGGMVWPDPGSVCPGRLSPSQSRDPFVNSLRRYPDPSSLEKSISTELVQKLISFTQNKHLTQNSKSRSFRSIRKEIPTKDQKTVTSNKNIQSNRSTRTEPRDFGAYANEIPFSFAKKGRSFASTSPLRNKSEHPSDTYDYLNPLSRRYRRNQEVRYLNGVTECVRDTIKQMCENKPVACPRIMNRYNQHVKNHHKTCSQESCPDAPRREKQASTSTSNEVPDFRRPRPPVATHQETCYSCKKSASCYCNTITGESAAEFLPKPTNTKSVFCYCKKDLNQSRNKIADEIFKWLKGLPVYADDSSENKVKREEIVKDLADKLQSLEGDSNYEERAKEEIMKCIGKLPMWYPGAKSDQDMFKNQISDDLFKQLTRFVGTDDLKDVVAKCLDDVQFVSKVDKERIVENFVDRLIPLINEPDKMKTEIEDMLQELPILNKNKVINELAEKITDNISDVVEKVLSKDKRLGTDLTDQELKMQIMDWLEDIPELSSGIKENKTMVRNLAGQLNNALKQGLDGKENQEQIKGEVMDWIDSILKSKGEKLDSNTKTKLSNKLLEMLINSAKSKRRDRKSSSEEQNDYEDQIWDWLEDFVDQKEENKNKHRKPVQNLTEKLLKLESENADDEVIEEKVMDFLESLSAKGVAVSSENMNKLAKKLLHKIKSISKPIKTLSQDGDLQQLIISKISELVDDNIPSNISKTKRKFIKEKIVDILGNNIDNLSTKSNNIKSGIMNVFKKEAKISEDEASDLAFVLIHSIKRMTPPDISKTTKLNEIINEIVLEEVSDILNDNNISAKKRKEVENSIKEVLADQIVRGLENKKTKDNIVSILKDANVSENGADDISNRLIERNEELSLIYETQQKAEKEILDFIEDITEDDSPKARRKIKDAAGELFYKLGEIMSDPGDTDTEKSIIKEVSQYLRKISIDSDIPREEMDKKLANRLQGITVQPKSSLKNNNKIKSTPKPNTTLSQDGDLQQSIISEIFQLVEDIPLNISKTKQKVIKEKVADILSKNIEHLSSKSDKIIIEIMNILKKEANIREDEALDLASDFIERIKEMPLSVQSKSSKLNEKIKKGVSEEASDILNDNTIIAKKRIEVEKSIKEIFADQVIRGTDDKKTKDNIISILNDANVSENDANDISNKLIERNEELSRRYESQEKAEKEILDFIEDITGDDSPNARKKKKDAVGELVFKLGEIMSDPGDTDTEKSIIKELSQYLRKISIDSDVPREEMARQLTNRLQGITFLATSTPKKEGYSFHPTRDISNISSIPIDESSRRFKKPVSAKSYEEKQYFNKLTELIQSWMDELPIDLNATQANGFKETMIQDLAADIIDTQKYLQLNPDAKISDQEELEHLKYQVFRWLNTLLDIEDLSPIMQNTESLMRNLKDVNVPKLVKPLGSKVGHGFIADSVDSVKDETTIWMEDTTGEYLTEKIDEWFNSLPIPKMNSTEALKFENMKKEFAVLVKQIRQEDPTNEKKLKANIRNDLLKFPIDENNKKNMKFINDKVDQLFKSLLDVSIENNQSNDIKKIVSNWVKLLPLATGKTVTDIPSSATDKLASTIENLLQNTPIAQISDIKNTLEEETKKFLKNVPLDPNGIYDVKCLAGALFKDVKEIPRKSPGSIIKSPRIKKAAEILLENIEKWCENLPINGNTKKEKEKAKKVNQEITNQLVHKIGELYMSPEVYNDDFIYYDLLEDEIDNLLTDLSIRDNKNNLPAIKKDLMKQVQEARQKTQEEVAGQAYKQQLRETISKTLPSQSLTGEEQASFEVLKDNLADAFINLHYVGGDKDQEKKYKTKINDAIGKFCNDYLKKHPASPVDSNKLNRDLYNALKGIPIPKEETMRNEFELAKLKDEVNEWVKQLPLKKQTEAEKLDTNKMIALLANKIHDIEKLKEIEPDADYDDEMRKEITKLVKKLPMDIDDAELTSIADKLINNLKSTEKSRRISASRRRSIEPETFEDTCTGACMFVVPPSTLSCEDREHLERIRERSSFPRVRYTPCKDASVSPWPVDAGSQTEVRPWESCKPSCGKRLEQQNSGVQAQRPLQQKTMQAVGSQAEVIPRVIVKEYYWDTLEDSTKLQGPPCRYSPCMTPVSQQPSFFSQRTQGPCTPCPISPQSSFPRPYASQTPTPQPRQPRKEWGQPCYRREMPEVSSEDHPEPGTNRSFRNTKERVTRLGSFNDMEPKCSRPRNWMQFSEDDDFWRDKSRSDADDASERERKKDDEIVTCRCREKILSKCSGRRRRCHTSCHVDDVKKCSKCCGVHCPYPSFLYFK